MPRGPLENLKPMPRLGTESLASQPLCVRVPQEVDAAVRSLPDTSAWLRRVITEAAQRELMSNQEAS
jgi:hypothetical protein